MLSILLHAVVPSHSSVMLQTVEKMYSCSSLDVTNCVGQSSVIAAGVEVSSDVARPWEPCLGLHLQIKGLC